MESNMPITTLFALSKLIEMYKTNCKEEQIKYVAYFMTLRNDMAVEERALVKSVLEIADVCTIDIEGGYVPYQERSVGELGREMFKNIVNMGCIKNPALGGFSPIQRVRFIESISAFCEEHNLI